MYQRNLDARLRDAFARGPVTVLQGARQTGKSTLAREVTAEYGARCVSLDDATVLAAASADPAGFLRGLGPVAVLDGVQRAPALVRAIDATVAAMDPAPRLLLVASARAADLPALERVPLPPGQVLTSWPLSQGELRDRRERFVDTVFGSGRLPSLKRAVDEDTVLVDALAAGGYPAAVARNSAARRRAWFGTHVSTVLQRDVRDLANIGRITELPRLLQLLALRSAGLLNISELSRASGVAQTTLKRYLSLLESIFLLQPLPAWAGAPAKRLVRAPKVHLIDAGLATHALGLSATTLQDDPVQLGRLLEGFVVAELRKQASWSDRQVSLSHYRTTGGREVDVVLSDAEGRVVGIDVRATAGVERRDCAGLEAFAEDAGAAFVRGIVLYGGTEVVSYGRSFAAMPVSALWRL